MGRLRQRANGNGARDYDVVLDDLGPSLVFTNVWPVPTDRDDAACGGQITVQVPGQVGTTLPQASA